MVNQSFWRSRLLMYRILLPRAATGVARLCPASCLCPEPLGEIIGGGSCLPAIKRYNERRNIAHPSAAIVLECPSSANHHELATRFHVDLTAIMSPVGGETV